eukprot:TRINITY_DN2320_c0_g1_i1.p1 TRINITY_DN2320_c0_g1~~TRINITY_DN2320_c0_g1_i1.p1  ORF type:complete len:111 (-),score=10.83 TRINITY_DN2320_c0_g1_i1:16-324(-)
MSGCKVVIYTAIFLVFSYISFVLLFTRASDMDQYTCIAKSKLKHYGNPEPWCPYYDGGNIILVLGIVIGLIVCLAIFGVVGIVIGILDCIDRGQRRREHYSV